MTMKEFKHRCKPGVRVHIEHHRLPHLTRDTVVGHLTSGRDLVTDRENGIPSYLPWPMRKDVVFNDDKGSMAVYIHGSNSGTPCLTITLLDG